MSKTFAILQAGVVVNLILGDSIASLPIPPPAAGDAPIDVSNRLRPAVGDRYIASADTFEPAPAPPAPAEVRIITVPAYLRRFDSCCATPSQAALACDPHPVCQGMLALALSRVNEGVDLDSQSLRGCMSALVAITKITQADAEAILATPVAQIERFKA